jgi:hypothetical protein
MLDMMKMDKIGAVLGFKREPSPKLKKGKSIYSDPVMPLITPIDRSGISCAPLVTPLEAEDGANSCNSKVESKFRSQKVVTPRVDECLVLEYFEIDENGSVLENEVKSRNPASCLGLEAEEVDTSDDDSEEENATRIEMTQPVEKVHEYLGLEELEIDKYGVVAEATESTKFADSRETKVSTRADASVQRASSIRSQEAESVNTFESKKNKKMMSIKSVLRSDVSIQRAPSNKTRGTGSAKITKTKQKKIPASPDVPRIQLVSSTPTESLAIDGVPLVIQDATAIQATSPARLLIMEDKMAMQETPPPQPLIISGSPVIIEDGTATTLTNKKNLIRSAGTFDTFDASTIKSTNSMRSPRTVKIYSDQNSVATTAGATYSTKGGDDRELWEKVTCQVDSAFDVAAFAGAAIGLLPTPSTMSMYDDDTFGGDTLMAPSPAILDCGTLDRECVEGKYIVIREDENFLGGESVLSESVLHCGENLMSKSAAAPCAGESALCRSMLGGESLIDGESVVMGNRSGYTVVKEKGVGLLLNGDVEEGVESPLPDSTSSAVANAKTGMKKKINRTALKQSVRSLFGGKTKKKTAREANVTTAESTLLRARRVH